ncbi:MAG: class I SAM-dependent methyltransferase [Thermodesulfobacteriota bacterium]
MRIHQEDLSDVTRFIEGLKHLRLDDKEHDYQWVMKRITKFKKITPETKILEIGTGIGWFPILCKRHGLSCKGLEISPQLIEYGKRLGRSIGIDADIELGNVEETDLGREQYDVIVASSLFEHVENWQSGLTRIYEALTAGGLMFFFSTNKYCPKSGEYPMPFYSWLPDTWRYRLRMARQGADIMKLGIDFHQFTYGRLRRFFHGLGYARVLDLFDIVGLDLERPTLLKKTLIKTARRLPALKTVPLTFVRGTMFICLK